MKKILLLLTLAPSLAFGQSYEVLFLGNSYTYYNNMPQQVADLASSFGDTINYDSNTPGGATFNGHSTNAATLAKIRQQDWDYVVLQAQSQEPSFSPWQVANDVYPYAQILVDSIAQNSLSTEPLFFMTWGRKYGDQQNCAAYPPICTYQGMQNRLRQSYLEMAATHNASASPVGISWQNAMALDSTIDLYSTDNSHPSIYGSYLAACTFYSSLFKKSCVGSSFWPTGIDSATAVFLQSVASSTVLDSLAVWKIFNADFTHSANGNSVVFTNSSSNYESLLWDFGDGNQSTDANPTHTYAASGSYTSTLTAYNNSNYFTDTISKVISVVSVLMTYVPDDNFEQALIDLGYDTGALDDSVPTANINTVAGLNVSSKNISDLTGIADFTWLLSLDCFSNNLDSLDLSHTNNLQHLDCSNNPLESLDISGASYLYYLYSDFCQLTTVDVTNNIYLEELDVEVNQIQNIDISQNTNMLELYFTFNQLTEIDVSHMGSLTVLQCNDNELTCLNVANGNNVNMNLIAFNNPNLACIEVDDTSWANVNWTPAGFNMDPTASFSDDCSSSCFPGFPQPNCALLEVTDVAIDDSSMTIDITIYNGDALQINYPYIGLVVDAMGDTIQNGFSWIFVQFAGDSVTYSNTLNSVSPVYPLTVYFAYSDMMGGMGTDTCVLSYAGPIFSQPDCSLLELTDVVFYPSNTTIEITIYNGDTNDINYPYIGLVVDAMGDTIQNGTADFFVQFAQDTMSYTYPASTMAPIYPLTVYFAYSDLMGGMGTDTCVLTTGMPLGISEPRTTNKQLLYITDLLGRTTHPVPNRVLLYIYDDGSVEKKIQLQK